MFLPKLNPIEPPWYAPVFPVVWEGWHREVSPYPDLRRSFVARSGPGEGPESTRTQPIPDGIANDGCGADSAVPTAHAERLR